HGGRCSGQTIAAFRDVRGGQLPFCDAGEIRSRFHRQNEHCRRGSRRIVPVDGSHGSFSPTQPERGAPGHEGNQRIDRHCRGLCSDRPPALRHFANRRALRCSAFRVPHSAFPMNFLTPAAFAFAAAIPVVIVFYLLKRKRVVRLVSSTLLWQKFLAETQASAPFQKLRKNWLLILQIIMLALVIFALARPYFAGQSKSSRLRV